MARLVRDGEVVEEAPLTYAGTPSLYTGRLRMPFGGSYTLEVLAMDARRVNFGRVARELAVRR